MKEIFCLIDRCLGCKSCEIACAIEHSRAKELVAAVTEDPLPSHRVRVRALDEQSGYVRLRSVALHCRQCAEPPCAEACISGGVTKDDITGVVTFNTENCVGCWSCIMVCPFGAVVRVQDAGIAITCDRCPDREVPACVVACPTNALMFCELEEFEETIESEISHNWK